MMAAIILFSLCLASINANEQLSNSRVGELLPNVLSLWNSPSSFPPASNYDASHSNMELTGFNNLVPNVDHQNGLLQVSPSNCPNLEVLQNILTLLKNLNRAKNTRAEEPDHTVEALSFIKNYITRTNSLNDRESNNKQDTVESSNKNFDPIAMPPQNNNYRKSHLEAKFELKYASPNPGCKEALDVLLQAINNAQLQLKNHKQVNTQLNDLPYILGSIINSNQPNPTQPPNNLLPVNNNELQYITQNLDKSPNQPATQKGPNNEYLKPVYEIPSLNANTGVNHLTNILQNIIPKRDNSAGTNLDSELIKLLTKVLYAKESNKGLIHNNNVNENISLDQIRGKSNFNILDLISKMKLQTTFKPVNSIAGNHMLGANKDMYIDELFKPYQPFHPSSSSLVPNPNKLNIYPQYHSEASTTVQQYNVLGNPFQKPYDKLYNFLPRSLLQPNAGQSLNPNLLTQQKNLLQTLYLNFLNNKKNEAPPIGNPNFVGNPYLLTYLTDYLKHNIYGNKFNSQHLPSVPNQFKLDSAADNNDVVELTYMLKRPRYLLDKPYYYVKYRLPYNVFASKVLDLLKNPFPFNPLKLYEELLSISNLAETSPDLRNYANDELSKLIRNGGTLVDAQVLAANNTSADQLLKSVQDLNAKLKTNQILSLAQNNIKLNANPAPVFGSPKQDSLQGNSSQAKPLDEELLSSLQKYLLESLAPNSGLRPSIPSDSIIRPTNVPVGFNWNAVNPNAMYKSPFNAQFPFSNPSVFKGLNG